jgi:hypothetical protein
MENEFRERSMNLIIKVSPIHMECPSRLPRAVLRQIAPIGGTNTFVTPIAMLITTMSPKVIKQRVYMADYKQKKHHPSSQFTKARFTYGP